MPRQFTRQLALLTLAPALALPLALAACAKGSPESEGNANPGSVQENSGMGAAGGGVGDNAPGASDGAAMAPGIAKPTSTPGGAADYPATGRP